MPRRQARDDFHPHGKRDRARVAASIRSVACMLLVASLAGCVWAPGQSMSKSSLGGENSSVTLVPITPLLVQPQQQNAAADTTSSEERRVGKEGVMTCRSRWSHKY